MLIVQQAAVELAGAPAALALTDVADQRNVH